MKRLFLLTSALSVALILFLFINPKMQNEIAEQKREKNEKQSANDYIQWWNRVRANQVTGVVDMTDVLAARQQAAEQGGIRDVGTLQWQEMGPDNIGGRTRAVIYDSQHPGRVFAGGVSGGLWRSDDSGLTWNKVNDLAEVNTVSCLAQGIDGTLYYGTGEGLYTNFGIGAGGFPGNGIYKSTDGGVTWSSIPATQPATFAFTTQDWCEVNRIACSTTDANIIYAATNHGLRVTTDGGATWALAGGTVVSHLAKDVKISGDGYVHACLSGKYYRSTTPNGTTFANVSNVGGFPNTLQPILARIEFATSAINPSYVYALTVASNGSTSKIVKSTDGGANWTTIGTGSTNFNITGNASYNQGDYDILLGIAPADPDVVIAGGVNNLWRYTSSEGWKTISIDGGQGFYPYYVHPDMHVITFNPNNPNEMLMGCDGGLFRSTNIMTTFPTFASSNRNYNVTQMYSVAAAPTGEVMGGTQDNGTDYINFLGNTPMYAFHIAGGDGGYSEISQFHSNGFFAGTPNGNLFRSSNTGSSFNTFFDCRIDRLPLNSSGECGGDGVMDDGAEFVTPFTLWEGDSSHSYFAAGSNTHVWFSKGALNFSVVPDWFQLNSSATSGAVSCVAFSADGNTCFAGTTNGVVYAFSNILAVDENGKFHYPSISTLGSGWVGTDSGLIVTSHTVASGRYIRAIAVDPTDANKIVVCAGNYGNSSFVWRSTNALSTFTFSDITNNLPHMPVYGVTLDRNNPNYLIAGTELGVWTRDLTTSTWTEQNAGMAHVPTLMVRSIPTYGQNYLYLGTHGRGIWRSSSLTGINSPKNNSIYNVSVFPNPATDNASVHISLSKAGNVTVRVLDLQGRLMKEISQPMSYGENVLNINIDQFGSGTYIVNVSVDGSSINRKIIVLN